jgi:S1-C subfamily serine protease
MIGARAQVERNRLRAERTLCLLTCAAFAQLLVPVLVYASVEPQVADATSAAAVDALVHDDCDAALRTAWWPFSGPRRAPLYESNPCNVTPHPAVARVIVPEGGVTSFGSGTLVDVREQYGLVVTNWHVVRDSCGVVKVVFPSGFRSDARPLKVDSNWDLAALVIWRPQIEPVKIASQPPRPGDVLTIHGYGRGQYRIATGRCTAYYAPHRNFPMEMVELDVEARQGDSGGPILNQQGEIAGVLFGAGQGTTLGSFAPRVSNFLASLAPDIGQVKDQAQVAVADRPAPNVEPVNDEYRNGTIDKYPSSAWRPICEADSTKPNAAEKGVQLVANHNRLTGAVDQSEEQAWKSVDENRWFDRTKSGLAILGLLAIGLRLVKIVT